MAADGRYARWVRIQQGKAGISEAEGSEPGAERETARRAREARARVEAGGLPPLEGHAPRWLRPDRDLFVRGPHGELRLTIPGEGDYRGIFVLRCFPVQHPERYLSVRYVNGAGRVQELGLIRSLAEWEQGVRQLVRESLSRRYFFHTIEKLHSVRKFSQFLQFSARTDLGDVEFIMRQSAEHAQDYGQTGKLLMDVEDNLYVLPDLRGLTRAERTMLDRHIYW
jgi:hypothetical protein